LLTQQFPVVTQTFVVNHAAALLARGHEVVVVPLIPRRDQDDLATTEFEDVVRATAAAPPAPAGGRLRRWFEGGQTVVESTRRHGGRPVRFARGEGEYPLKRFSARLLCATRLERAAPLDVVHAHFGPTGVAAVALRAAGLFDAPIVCSFHGYDANVIAAQKPGCYDPMLGRVARVTAGTEFMRHVVEGLGFAPVDVTVWPQGVDTAQFAPRAERRHDAGGFHALSVARLVDFKGVDVALRAVALARPKIAGLRYTIIGDGERRSELEALAAELGVADITSFQGARPHDEVLAAFGDADAFVLTGRVDAEGQKEGQGVAPLEAAASGLPVIASRAGGLTEVVRDGETGLLVEPEDAQGAADALVALASDRAMATQMGAAGRAHVERSFSQSHSIDVIEQVYRECAAGATP
jgi:colanic acid/amylovoran biosynthesis glycosyltransferase